MPGVVELEDQRVGLSAPAEALIAVVEIKSMFSRAEARVCLKAATAIAKLNVYNRNFVPARAAGESASDGAPRCMYSILAFDSDIVPDGWTVKEWKRLVEADLAG